MCFAISLSRNQSLTVTASSCDSLCWSTSFTVPLLCFIQTRVIFSWHYICAIIRFNILHFLVDTSLNSNHSHHTIKPDHIINHDHTAQHHKQPMVTDTQLEPWRNCPWINFSLVNIHGQNVFFGGECLDDFWIWKFPGRVNYSQENFGDFNFSGECPEAC